jgi:hypothetical protein
LTQSFYSLTFLFVLTALLISCNQTQNNYASDPDNIDSIVLAQVDHPYLGGHFLSQKLDKRYFSDFLKDFDDKRETVVKFYSCYVVKLYYKNGQWSSYRTNGQLFEKMKDEKEDGNYFEIGKDKNIVTKYWAISQDKFCDTTK